MKSISESLQPSAAAQNEIRKFLTLVGNDRKDAINTAVYELLGDSPDAFDEAMECEVCVALLARELQANDHRLPMLKRLEKFFSGFRDNNSMIAELDHEILDYSVTEEYAAAMVEKYRLNQQLVLCQKRIDDNRYPAFQKDAA